MQLSANHDAAFYQWRCAPRCVVHHRLRARRVRERSVRHVVRHVVRPWIALQVQGSCVASHANFAACVWECVPLQVSGCCVANHAGCVKGCVPCTMEQMLRRKSHWTRHARCVASHVTHAGCSKWCVPPEVAMTCTSRESGALGVNAALAAAGHIKSTGPRCPTNFWQNQNSHWTQTEIQTHTQVANTEHNVFRSDVNPA